MRGEPADVGTFDIAGQHAEHLTVGGDINVWPTRIGWDVPLASGAIFLSGLPDARVPLADEAGPFLNVQICGFITNLEGSLVIAIGRRCQQVESLEVPCG